MFVAYKCNYTGLCKELDTWLPTDNNFRKCDSSNFKLVRIKFQLNMWRT